MGLLRLQVMMKRSSSTSFLLCVCLSLTFLSPLFVTGSNVQLTPGASSIESAFPDNVGDASTPRSVASLSPLKGAVITVAGQLMASAAAAYKAVKKDFIMNFQNSPTNAGIKANFFAHNSGFDYAISTASPTSADMQSLPSLAYFPLQSNGIVPTFNLPISVRNGAVLALSGPTMCRIMRGNITSWTDPAITITNPTFNFAPAIGQGIKILLLSTASATHLAFSTYCNKIDPAYQQLGILPSSKPVYPTGNYAAVKWYTDIDLMDSGVSDETWCFTITTLSNARTINLPIGNFINTQGEVITATTNSMSLNLFELATNGYAPGTNSYDLTNPQTAQAWPILTMSYLYVDKSGTSTTCSTKRELLSFFLWFYNSEVVKSIGETLSIVLFPSVFVSQLQIIENIRAQLTCLDAQLISANQQIGHISIHSLASQTMQLYASFYLTVDSTRTYTVSTVSESLALQRIVAGELDLAVVNPSVFTSTDRNMLSVARTSIIPAFVVGVVPIFNLPTQIASWAAANKDAAAALPSLLPLKLDLETMTKLFLGHIDSWIDPSMTRLNPQLISWFGNSSAPTNLSLVVGATGPTESRAAAALLFQTMATSQTAQLPENQPFFPVGVFTGDSNPFAAVVKADADRAALDGSPTRFTMIDSESRLTLKSSVIPGSVSYRLISHTATTSIEFAFVQKNTNGQVETVLPQVSSLESCSAPYLTPLPSGLDRSTTSAKYAEIGSLANQQAWINPANPAPGCWPVSTLLSFAVSLEYLTNGSGSGASSTTVDSCTSGLHALEFINYVQSTSILTAPASSFGVVRLADSPLIEALSQDWLYQATCDGTSLLVIDPTYYTVASAVQVFGTAIGLIGLLMSLISIGIIHHFRFRVVIRSASAPFLSIILTGMALLFGALISWSREPTSSSCLAFQWTFNFGFMCLFVPLFLKTWRVWRIFSGAHLRVVKLSNLKLMAITGAILLAEIVLLTIWSGVSPLQPIEYSRELATIHYFTHCSVTSTGMPFVIIEATFKAALLLFGAIMAFSTRNVKGSYNEASQIGMTIYQTVLASIILIGIIVFISAVEAVLTILVAIYLIWICFASCGILFGPKFFMLFQSEIETIEASRSELPQEKSQGFSFASIAVMSNTQLKQYYYALRLQIHKAELRLSLPKTNFAEFKGFVPNANNSRRSTGGDRQPPNTNTNANGNQSSGRHSRGELSVKSSDGLVNGSDRLDDLPLGPNESVTRSQPGGKPLHQRPAEEAGLLNNSSTRDLISSTGSGLDRVILPPRTGTNMRQPSPSARYVSLGNGSSNVNSTRRSPSDLRTITGVAFHTQTGGVTHGGSLPRSSSSSTSISQAPTCTINTPRDGVEGAAMEAIQTLLPNTPIAADGSCSLSEEPTPTSLPNWAPISSPSQEIATSSPIAPVSAATAASPISGLDGGFAESSLPAMTQSDQVPLLNPITQVSTSTAVKPSSRAPNHGK